MLTKGNEKALSMDKEEVLEMISTVFYGLEQHDRYADIIYYLKNLTCSDHLVDYKRRALRLKESKYRIVHRGMGWRNPKDLVMRCVDDVEARRLINYNRATCRIV